MSKTNNYYKVALKVSSTCNTLIDLYESKKLTSKQYHKVSVPEIDSYKIIVPVSKTVNSDSQAPFWNSVIPAEAYDGYQFKEVSYTVENDIEKDNFYYDKKNKMVIYGWTFIYAIKEDNQYYDLITGKLIPSSIIQSTSSQISLDDYELMIKDLELIKQHKEIYEKITNELYEKLEEDNKNYQIAQQKYNDNLKKFLEERREQLRKTREEKETQHIQHLEEDKPKIKVMKGKITQLISEIKDK